MVIVKNGSRTYDKENLSYPVRGEIIGMITWKETLGLYNNMVLPTLKRAWIDKESGIKIEEQYQSGMIKLYDCWKQYNHLTIDEYKQVLSQSI